MGGGFPVPPDQRNHREAHSHSPRSVLDAWLSFPSPHSPLVRSSHSHIQGSLRPVPKARHPADGVRSRAGIVYTLRIFLPWFWTLALACSRCSINFFFSNKYSDWLEE